MTAEQAITRNLQIQNSLVWLRYPRLSPVLRQRVLRQLARYRQITPLPRPRTSREGSEPTEPGEQSPGAPTMDEETLDPTRKLHLRGGPLDGEEVVINTSEEEYRYKHNHHFDAVYRVGWGFDRDELLWSGFEVRSYEQIAAG